MIHRVVLTVLMLFSTWSVAHDNGCGEPALNSETLAQRIDAHGLKLAELSALAGLLQFRVPEFREKAGGVVTRVVALQLELRQVRGALSTTQQAVLLSQFEQNLRQQLPEIQSTLSQGQSLFAFNNPKEAANYGIYVNRRGVQHPDRPMKRETIGFGDIPGVDGLQNWPIDWSQTSASPTPGPREVVRETAPPIYDFPVPWHPLNPNWPPKEKP